METRTNIFLDDELVDKAMSKAGVTTKKAAVEIALRDYVRQPDWKGLLDLEGSQALADDYDPSKPFNNDRNVRDSVGGDRPAKRKSAGASTKPRPKAAETKRK